jgi:hypothetical protein
MTSRIVYQLACIRPRKNLARAWQWQHVSESILALVYVSDLAEESPTSTTLTFLLLDVKTEKVLQSVSWTFPREEIEVLRLIYEPLTMTWVIGLSEWGADNLYHLAVRAIAPERTILSLWDDWESDMTPPGPLYTMYTYDTGCVVVYRKPAPYFHGPSTLSVRTIDVETKAEDHMLVEDTDSAMVWTDEHTTLVLSINSYMDTSASLALAMNPYMDVSTAGRWCFQLSCYDAVSYTPHWQQKLAPCLTETSIPVLQGDSDFEWLGINAAICAGPLLAGSGEPTWVVGAALTDIFRLTGRGHSSAEASRLPRKVDLLLWINALGEERQRCTERIGLCVQMCRVQSTMVGVDVFNGQWRVWNWVPQQAASFQSVIWLDETVSGVHVVAGEETAQQRFWLIEDRGEGVRISRRDAQTLAEVVPGETLPGVHLLEPQNGPGSLDWHSERDIAVYQETLLVLGINEKSQIALYQVG